MNAYNPITAKIFTLCLLFIVLLGFISCSRGAYTQEHKQLLMQYLETFTAEDYPLYHQTITKEKLSRYFRDDFALEYTYFYVDPPDSLDIYFNDRVLNDMFEERRDYEQVPITDKLSQGHPVVKDEDIPEFVKYKHIPPSYNYRGFENVNFISTPLISGNRAIIFVDNYGDASNGGLHAKFFIRDSKTSKWQMIATGGVFNINY